MTVLNRKLITRMVNPQPGGNGGGAGGAVGAGAYVLPAASNSELGGVKLGYPTGTGKLYPVQLDSQQRAYVDVPWTDHTYTLAGLVGGSVIGGTTQPIYWNGSSFVNTSYTLAKSVPSDAVFTDTDTWRPLGTGANDAAAGNHLHDDRYLKLTGGTITGDLTVNQTFLCQSVEIGQTNEINATGSSNLYLQYRNSGNLVLCYNGQNVGIGDANPAYKLEVGGNCRISSKLLVATTDSTYELNVGGTIYATGSITERSDIRCKDVETYQWSPTLDMIADAPIIRYTMKDDKTHRMRVGSVAQYWEKMMPEAVSKDNDGILSIAQGDICMVNVIALAREVRKLREEIIQLKKWA